MSEPKRARLTSEPKPAAVLQQPPAGGAPQWAHAFATIYPPPSDVSSQQAQRLQTKEQTSEKLNEKPGSQQDHSTSEVSQHLPRPQPIDSKTHSCNQTLEETTLSHDDLLRSLFAFAAKLLARETRPLPASTISADLWQLRWPLACLVIFALYSPHIPPALSLFTWSVFLLYFVAELRGWNGSE